VPDNHATQVPSGQPYQAVVIGTSAGGTAALAAVLPGLPAGYRLPIIICQHLHPRQHGPALLHYCDTIVLRIKEAGDKEHIQPGTIYFAPPNYHLLIEEDRSLALSIDERVNFTRPSIDVLFESAADAYGPALVGVILTGANHDGAQGLRRVKERGGLTIVQDPRTAEASFMPEAALHATAVDHVLALGAIGGLLAGLSAPAQSVGGRESTSG